MPPSTIPAKVSKTDEKTSTNQASPAASRATHLNKPVSKTSVPPKRPLTTPRAPSFADRSRPNTSSIDAPSQRPGSRLNNATSSSTSTPRQSPRAPPITQSRTNSRALPHSPKARPGSREIHTKRGVTSPAPVKDTTQSILEDERDNETITEDHDAILNLRQVADRKDDEIAELRGQLAEFEASGERRHKEASRAQSRVRELEAELMDVENKLRHNEEESNSASRGSQSLARSKDDELREIEGTVQDLKDEIHSLRREKDKELRDADRLHAQQLKEAAAKLEQSFRSSSEGLERELRKQISEREQELKEVIASHENILQSSDSQKQKQPDQLMVNHDEGVETAAKQREEDLRSQLAEAQAVNQSSLAITTKELEAVRQSLGELERDNSNHEEELRAQRRDYERRLYDQDLQFQRERKDLDNELRSKKSECSDLRIQCQQENATKSAEIQRLMNETIRLEEALKKIQEESSREQDEAKSKATAQLSAAQAQIRRLEEASLDHEQHFRNTVQKNRTDQEIQINQVEREMRGAQQAQQELQQSLELARKQNEELKAKQRDLEANSKRSKTELEDLLARQESQDIREQHAHEELRNALKDIEGLKDLLVQKQKLIDESDARQKCLETDVLSVKGELDGARGKHQELERDIAQCMEDIEIASRERESLAVAKDASSKATEESLVRESKLQAEVDRSTHTILALNAEIANLRQSFELKLEEITSLQAEHRAKEDMQASTMEEIAMKHGEAIKALEDRHHEAIEHASDAHQYALAEITALQTAIKSIEDDSASKQESLDAQQRQQVAALRDETNAAIQAELDLRQKLVEQIRAREAAEQLASEFEGQVKDAWTTRSKKLEGLQRDHETALKQLSELQAHTVDLRSKAKAMEDAATRSNTALNDLKLEHAELVKVNCEQNATIQQLEREQARLIQEHTSNREQTHSAHKHELAHLITLQGAHRQLLQDQNTLTAENSALREQQENLHREITTLKHRLRHLDTAHTEATAKAQSLAQQLHEGAKTHSAEIDNLKQQVETAKMQGAQRQQAAQIDHSDLRRHISALGRQYTTDVADIDSLRADMAMQRSAREVAWQRGAEGRKHLLAELEKVRGQWMGNVRVDGS